MRIRSSAISFVFEKYMTNLFLAPDSIFKFILTVNKPKWRVMRLKYKFDEVCYE